MIAILFHKIFKRKNNLGQLKLMKKMKVERHRFKTNITYKKLHMLCFGISSKYRQESYVWLKQRNAKKITQKKTRNKNRKAVKQEWNTW